MKLIFDNPSPKCEVFSRLQACSMQFRDFTISYSLIIKFHKTGNNVSYSTVIKIFHVKINVSEGVSIPSNTYL